MGSPSMQTEPGRARCDRAPARNRHKGEIEFAVDELARVSDRDIDDELDGDARIPFIDVGKKFRGHVTATISVTPSRTVPVRTPGSASRCASRSSAPSAARHKPKVPRPFAVGRTVRMLRSKNRLPKLCSRSSIRARYGRLGCVQPFGRSNEAAEMADPIERLQLLQKSSEILFYWHRIISFVLICDRLARSNQSPIDLALGEGPESPPQRTRGGTIEFSSFGL